MTDNKIESPIKSGWRGNMNGAVEHTSGTEINVSETTLKLDSGMAWALCNVLTDSALEMTRCCTEDNQRKLLSTLGAALGRLIDHPAANNGGRECVK